MSESEKIELLATKVMGWWKGSVYWYTDQRHMAAITGPCKWNPVKDIADAWMVESAIPEDKRMDYYFALQDELLKTGPVNGYSMIHATPEKRCNAAIKVMGGRP